MERRQNMQLYRNWKFAYNLTMQLTAVHVQQITFLDFQDNFISSACMNLVYWRYLM